MPAPRKYPDELRERAVRLVLDVAEEAGSVEAGRAGGSVSSWGSTPTRCAAG